MNKNKQLIGKIVYKCLKMEVRYKMYKKKSILNETLL